MRTACGQPCSTVAKLAFPVASPYSSQSHTGSHATSLSREGRAPAAGTNRAPPGDRQAPAVDECPFGSTISRGNNGGFSGAWLDRHGIRPSYLGLGRSALSGSGGPSSAVGLTTLPIVTSHAESAAMLGTMEKRVKTLNQPEGLKVFPLQDVEQIGADKLNHETAGKTGTKIRLGSLGTVCEPRACQSRLGACEEPSM